MKRIRCLVDTEVLLETLRAAERMELFTIQQLADRMKRPLGLMRNYVLKLREGGVIEQHDWAPKVRGGKPAVYRITLVGQRKIGVNLPTGNNPFDWRNFRQFEPASTRAK